MSCWLPCEQTIIFPMISAMVTRTPPSQTKNSVPNYTTVHRILKGVFYYSGWSRFTIQVPRIMMARAMKNSTPGISLKMSRDRNTPIKGATA